VLISIVEPDTLIQKRVTGVVCRLTL